MSQSALILTVHCLRLAAVLTTKTSPLSQGLRLSLANDLLASPAIATSLKSSLQPGIPQGTLGQLRTTILTQRPILLPKNISFVRPTLGSRRLRPKARQQKPFRI